MIEKIPGIILIIWCCFSVIFIILSIGFSGGSLNFFDFNSKTEIFSIILTISVWIIILFPIVVLVIRSLKGG